MDIALAVAAGQQLTGEVDELAAVGQTCHTAVTVEIGTEAHMVDAHDLDGMLQMSDGIHDRGLTVALQKAGIKGGLCHTSF